MKQRLSVFLVLALAFSLSVISVTLVTNVFSAELTDGLVGYWPLDGNGKDESGNGHDAELAKGAKWSNDGWVNGAVEVDGGGGHVVVDNKFGLTTDAITAVARVNGWKTIDWSGIVVGRGTNAFWMGVSTTNTLTYVWNNNAEDTWGWAGAPEIPEDNKRLATVGLPVEATGKLTSTWAAIKRSPEQ